MRHQSPDGTFVMRPTQCQIRWIQGVQCTHTHTHRTRLSIR